jgi:hypothetical protein
MALRSTSRACGSVALACAWTRCGSLLVALGLGCSDGARPELAPWRVVAESPAAALLSVSGSAIDDVWMVGADAGQGPPVLHWDGAGWTWFSADVQADLWWVQAPSPGSAYFGGSSATVLVLADGVLERLATPGLARDTVFGVWAASPSDVYAVGSAAGRNGFVWHFDGQSFVELALPDTLPQDESGDLPGFYKVWGASPSDVWVVGDRGVVLHGNASDGFRSIASGSDERLFTVHGAGGRVVMVGGSGNGFALEAMGDELVPITPPGSSLLQGVSVSDSGAVWTVGLGGNVYHQDAPGAAWQDAIIDTPVQSLHSVWVDASGGAWAVGGNVLSDGLDRGVAVRGGAAAGVLPVVHVTSPALPDVPVCPATEVDPAPQRSIARRWNEQLLAAIRRDVPRSMVHARNLFHVSVAIWDAWAAYDEVADGYVSSERATAADVDAARTEAISFAAYRVLEQRFAAAAGGALSRACFEAFMRALGYDPLDATSDGDAPRALGNRIGRAVLDAFAGDGANEAGDYSDPDGYVADNPPLVVDAPGTVLDDPRGWQPLALSDAVTLNGITLGSGVQGYAGAHWGNVSPFSLERPSSGEAYLDIGSPPSALDDSVIEGVVEVIRRSAELGADDGVRWDVSPGAYGNNSLGNDDGRGRSMNPVTAAPYAPNIVPRSDFARALVEYWANGPRAETPPGHWNVLANAVAADDRFERQLFGVSSALDPLAWDAHLYLALNGALHDAAIAAWELKRRYTSARPITLVRHLGGLGQRSDPAAPAYDAGGLPLVEGSIEVITDASSAPGERHAQLRRHAGELALRAWPGEPGDRERQVASVRWLRARDWVPYQPRSFVSPPHPGYVSEHSAFSRAAAELLRALTGSEYFPGGLLDARVAAGALTLEAGPSEEVPLEWATYADAADQAGQSCVWGGISLAGDDRDGRRVGARVGAAATERARAYFEGSARP